MTDPDRNRLAVLCKQALAWDYRHAGELITLLRQFADEGRREEMDRFVYALDESDGDERQRLEEAFAKRWQETREFLWEARDES